MDYCVYVHTFPNGKRYVGITSQLPERRWKNGHAYHGQSYVWNAISKYGWHNIRHDVLYTGLTKFEACAIERQLIHEWRTAEKEYGYNIALGGVANTAGRHHSEETRRKMSESHIGINTWARGRKNPKLAERQSRPIVCLETFVVYHSGKEASEKTGANHGHIIQCCKGRRKTAGGYHWKYESEVETT